MAKYRTRKDMSCVLTFVIDAIDQEEQGMHDDLITGNMGKKRRNMCAGFVLDPIEQAKRRVMMANVVIASCAVLHFSPGPRK